MKIGNKKSILFVLDNKIQKLQGLKFYLGGRLISDENIYIPTYISVFERFLKSIIAEQFQNVTMENLQPEERFKKLIKERDSNEDQFFKHLLHLDETIDQYSIFIFQSNNLTDFTWSCWDKNNCNSNHELNKVYSLSIPIEEVISTINKLILQLKENSAISY